MCILLHAYVQMRVLDTSWYKCKKQIILAFYKYPQVQEIYSTPQNLTHTSLLFSTRIAIWHNIMLNSFAQVTHQLTISLLALQVKRPKKNQLFTQDTAVS